MGVDKRLFIHYSVVKAKQAAVTALEFKINLHKKRYLEIQTPPKLGFVLLRYENISAHQRLHNDGRMCYKRNVKSEFTKHRHKFDEKIYFFIR